MCAKSKKRSERKTEKAREKKNRVDEQRKTTDGISINNTCSEWIVRAQLNKCFNRGAQLVCAFRAVSRYITEFLHEIHFPNYSIILLVCAVSCFIVGYMILANKYFNLYARSGHVFRNCYFSLTFLPFCCCCTILLYFLHFQVITLVDVQVLALAYHSNQNFRVHH